jgi:hypothetical protein
MNKTLTDICVAVNDLVKQVSLLVKVTGTSNASTPLARVGGRYKDEIDQEFLKQLKHPQLLELCG